MNRANDFVIAATVNSDVAEERRRQDEKWEVQNHDPLSWLVILSEEVGEASREALEARFGTDADYAVRLQRLRAELVQVAAVAHAFLECLDRNKWSWGD